ncbi:hypothetical protein [Legionella sp. CNM-4043-24]|uniref:hypothetical protein n=1 Tax=Legionella sp. CNM-4043-24 TaxID=3421646 RepID=UPI00403B238D
MPLTIPRPGRSMQPFFEEVQNRLSDYYGFRLFSSELEPRANKDIVRAIVNDMSRGVLTDISSVLQRLRQAPLNADPTIQRYTGEIINGLRTYLLRTDRHGKNVLMLAAPEYYHEPGAVHQILAAMENLDPEDRYAILNHASGGGENALMLAAIHPPTAEAILTSMTNLSPEQQFEILRRTTMELNISAMMIAARRRAAHLIPFITAMQNLSLEQKFALLSQSSNYENILMIAVANSPEAVALILAAMQDLSPDQKQDLSRDLKYALLSQNSFFGKNALIIAAENNPEAVAPILAAMQDLSPDQNDAIISQIYRSRINGHPENVLLTVSENSPAQVPVILNIMRDFSPEQKLTVLREINWEGFNALMIAIFSNPENAAPILETMEDLNSDQKYAVLSQQSVRGNNALMIAVLYRPETIAPLLAAMQNLSPEQKYEILRQTSNKGNNPLMMAARSHPDAVAPLLAVMQDLSPDQKYEILRQTSNIGNNALMLAARSHPDAVAQLLAVMQALSPAQKQTIMLTENETDENALEIARAHQNTQQRGAHSAFELIARFMEEMYTEPAEAVDLYDAPPKAGQASVPAAGTPQRSPASSSSSSSPAALGLFSQGARSFHSEQSDIQRLTGLDGWRIAGDSLTLSLPRENMMELLGRLLQFEGLEFSYKDDKETGCTISVKIDSVSQLDLRPENQRHPAPVPTDRASQSTNSTSTRPEQEKADDEEPDAGYKHQ